MVSLGDIFSTPKPVIGMIHLAGDSRTEKLERALEELRIYDREGVDGAIIEDYHGSREDVYETMKASSKMDFRIVRGVNVLRNPYWGFTLAADFGGRFVQFDSVQSNSLNWSVYGSLRKQYPHIAVLGGVGFKYTRPTGRSLEEDIQEGKERCEAIVTTGSGTGVETPSEKLKEFKRLLADFPLIVGAGVTARNVFEQLSLCDGAIVGSYFKPGGDTTEKVDSRRVGELMDAVRKVREKKG